MSLKKYVTTPIYYVNAKPHFGHAYTTFLADFIKRSTEMGDDSCFFITGTDEHGEKIAQSAAKNKQSPQEFCDEIAALYRKNWDDFGLNYDNFYRTTQKSHYELVQKSLQKLKDNGDIYLKEYEGKYCVGCERFRTDAEWTDDDKCPDHLTPAEFRKEPNYFFKMSSYQERLLEFYKKNPDSIYPNSFLNETLALLKEPLGDLSISRPKNRVSWGIPLPFDDEYVTYVWFDALLNYLGGIGYNGDEKNPEFDSELWKNSQHLLGKDILKTHAIYWPTMLMSLGFEPAKRLLVHGMWLSDGHKMSKSLGNVIDPYFVQKEYGLDLFRYFIFREMSIGIDSNFTWKHFVQVCNTDLANGLGNLCSRILTLIKKNFDLKVPENTKLLELDEDLLAKVKNLSSQMQSNFDSGSFHLGIKSFAETIKECGQIYKRDKTLGFSKGS